MMTDNELDNLFKNTLSNHEAPIPADMWQRIQPGDTKKRPVVLWWRWYTAAAILIVAGIATWWYADTAHVSINKTTSYNAANKKENKQQTIADTSNQRTTATPKQENNNLDNPLSSTSNSPSITYNKQTAPSANKQPTGTQDITSKQEKATRLNTSAPGAVLNKKTTVNKEEEQLTSNTDDNTAKTQTYSAPATSIAPENKTPDTGNTTALNTPTANTKGIDSVTNTANNKKNNKKQKLPWSIEIFASSAYADKQTYDVVKENTFGMAAPIPPPQPKPSLWNYDAGIRLGIPVTKNITVKTGLQFAQTRQKAAYQQQNAVDMIAVNGGNDTTFYRQLIYQTENQNSTFNSISIPVLISYQTGNKIRVGATAGVVVNAYSWYKGKVPNATYSATLDAKETYKHNTGAALYAGITVAKKVGSVEIFAEPHLQYGLSSLTKPSVPFKQKINTYGLSIGVRKALHK